MLELRALFRALTFLVIKKKPDSLEKLFMSDSALQPLCYHI